MKLTLGHSPDPDDAFMFYALAKNRIDSEGLEFEHILQDIETLNRRAEGSELDVTALSAHAYAFLTDRYILLNSGASMGQGYGPMVVSREAMEMTELSRKKIAIPGIKTSAFLALRLCIGDFEYIQVPFDEIIETVARGKADAGLIIHEGQLTYGDEGLRLVVDLGVWWGRETGGLPLPLGVNAIRKDLPPDVLERADRVLRKSVEWGLAHRQEALEHAGKWGRNLNSGKTDEFVAMYVNDLTLDYGEQGRAALVEFFARAAKAGLIPMDARAEFVEHRK